MIDRSVEVCPDPEELAAYIDRSLPKEGRQRIAEHLSGCADCYEVFSETVRLLDEDEEEAGAEDRGGVGTVHHGPWRRLAPFAAALAAALVIGFGLSLLLPSLLGPWHALSRGSSRDAVASLDVSALPEGRLAGLAGDSVHGWSTSRGVDDGERTAGFEGPLGLAEASPSASFQLGVLSFDLALTLELGDRALSGELLATILDLSKGESIASGLLEYELSDLASRLSAGEEPAALGQDWEDLEAALRGWVDEEVFRFGRWAEAGRLAAIAEDQRFLGRMAGEGAAAAVDDPPVMEVVAGPVAQELQAILGRTREGVDGDDLPLLEQSFADIVSLGGGGWGAEARQP